MAIHPLQASPSAAEAAFSFLGPLGFSLRERRVTGGDSFKDGWRLSFSSPQVQFFVQYLDSQFEVHFAKAGLTVSYLEIDRDLFDRRSGFHGNMFPPEKLGGAIHRIADDIRAHYHAVLAGDASEWERLARLTHEPQGLRQLP